MGIVYYNIEVVLSDILGIDGGNVVLNFDIKIIWWKFKLIKKKNVLIGLDVEIFLGL